MNIGKITATLSILGLTAGITAGAALAQDVLSETTPSGIDDTTGLSAIGIDITTAGTGPAEVQQFIAGLAPETQRGVLGGCQTAVTYPANIAPNVVQFCENALGAAPAAGTVMGFAPPEEQQFVPSPMIGAEPNGSSGAY